MDEFRGRLRPRVRDHVLLRHPMQGRVHQVAVERTNSNPDLTLEELYAQTASVLQSEVFDAIVQTRHVTPGLARRSMGFLQLTTTGHNGGRAHLPDIRVSDITGATIGQLFWNAQQSNETVGFASVIIAFNILDSGGAPMNVKYQGCVKDVPFKELVEYEGEMVPVNCAALALEYLWFHEIYDLEERHKRKRRQNFKQTMAHLAFQKQRALGWDIGFDASIYEFQIQDYLEFDDFKDHRIVIVYPTLRDHRLYDYSGREYV